MKAGVVRSCARIFTHIDLTSWRMRIQGYADGTHSYRRICVNGICRTIILIAKDCLFVAQAATELPSDLVSFLAMYLSASFV